MCDKLIKQQSLRWKIAYAPQAVLLSGPILMKRGISTAALISKMLLIRKAAVLRLRHFVLIMAGGRQIRKLLWQVEVVAIHPVVAVVRKFVNLEQQIQIVICDEAGPRQTLP